MSSTLVVIVSYQAQRSASVWFLRAVPTAYNCRLIDFRVADLHYSERAGARRSPAAAAAGGWPLAAADASNVGA